MWYTGCTLVCKTFGEGEKLQVNNTNNLNNDITCIFTLHKMTRMGFNSLKKY